MYREPNGTPSVGDTTSDRLTDPPCGIGRELESFTPVEFLDGVHQTEVAFLDQVEQGETRSLVLFGDRYNKTKVGLDEGAFGIVAGTKVPSELTFASRRGFFV